MNDLLVDNKKFNRLFLVSAFAFFCLNMLILNRRTDSIINTVIFYCVNVVICFIITLCFSFALKKDIGKNKSIYALLIILSAEPYFLINMMFEGDYRRLAVFILFTASLFLVRSKKAIYFVPLFLVLMMIAMPVTAIAIAPFVVLILYYERMIDENNNTLPLIIICSFFILAVVILSTFFQSSSISIFLFGDINTSINLIGLRSFGSHLMYILEKFVLAEFPVIIVLIMMWKSSIANNERYLLLNFFCINLIVSLVSLLLTSGKFAYMLCGIQFIILIYLYIRGEREIISGVDKSVSLLRKHPLIVIAAVIWCASFKSYLSTSTAFTLDSSAIMSAINRFISVNS